MNLEQKKILFAEQHGAGFPFISSLERFVYRHVNVKLSAIIYRITVWYINKYK